MSNLDGLSDIEGSLDPVLFAVTSNPVYTISVISVYADDIAQILESLTALRKGLCPTPASVGQPTGGVVGQWRGRGSHNGL